MYDSEMTIRKQKSLEAQTMCSSCNALSKLQGAQYAIIVCMMLLVVAPGGNHGLNIPQFRMGGGGPQIPPSRNCTGKECEEVAKQRDNMMRHRLAKIHQTFQRMELQNKPKSTRATNPMAGLPGSQETLVAGLLTEVSEIVSFAEEVLGKLVYILAKF